MENLVRRVCQFVFKMTTEMQNAVVISDRLEVFLSKRQRGPCHPAVGEARGEGEPARIVASIFFGKNCVVAIVVCRRSNFIVNL